MEFVEDGFRQVIAAWQQRCSAVTASLTITSPTALATATGSGGLCRLDMCLSGSASLDKCITNGRSGTVTNFASVTSCACDPPLLNMLSICWLVDKPRCLGEAPNTTYVKENYLYQSCEAVKTIFDLEHVTVSGIVQSQTRGNTNACAELLSHRLRSPECVDGFCL